MDAPRSERRDVFIFPAHGTYRRIPIAEAAGDFSFKAVPVPAEIAVDGKAARLVFVSPDTKRAPPATP